MLLSIFILGAAFGIALMNIVELLIALCVSGKRLTMQIMGNLSFNTFIICVTIYFLQKAF